MQSRDRLWAGGIHLGGSVAVIGFGFAYWFLPAFGRSAPFVWLLVLPVVLITYLVMRKRPSSFLKRQLTCAVGIQTLSLLVPLVMVVASIVALFEVPGFGWFNSKLGLVTKGPFTGWWLNQVGALVGSGFVTLLAGAAAVRAFRAAR